MPRPKEQKIPFLKMKRLLLSYGMNGVKLGLVLGCSHVSARKKLNNPWLLTLNDLDAINKFIPIPWEEIREAIVR